MPRLYTRLNFQALRGCLESVARKVEARLSRTSDAYGRRYFLPFLILPEVYLLTNIDCTSCAVEQRMIRLRKQAASASPAASSSTGGGAASANSTPTKTPRKRKGDGLATPAKKKTKTAAAASAKSEVKKDDTTTANEDGKAEIKVKPEIKNEPME